MCFHEEDLGGPHEIHNEEAVEEEEAVSHYEFDFLSCIKHNFGSLYFNILKNEGARHAPAVGSILKQLFGVYPSQYFLILSQPQIHPNLKLFLCSFLTSCPPPRRRVSHLFGREAASTAEVTGQQCGWTIHNANSYCNADMRTGIIAE
jgi:hypothetical protein